MTKKKTCVNCTCDPAEGTRCDEKTELSYGFYSNVLKKPFERLEDLKRAEEVYYAEQKAKEDKVAQKKADAQKVGEAFKALNTARKTYKEELTQLTKEYAEELETLHDTLAEAEEAYEKALKEFNAKYPEGYHLTLKGDDFETTISRSTSSSESKDVPKTSNIFELFDWLFSF